MSTEERDDLNPEEDPGLRRENEDVEGHKASVRATDDADADADDDDVEAHKSSTR